jgi:hypothetical protein
MNEIISATSARVILFLNIITHCLAIDVRSTIAAKAAQLLNGPVNEGALLRIGHLRPAIPEALAIVDHTSMTERWVLVKEELDALEKENREGALVDLCLIVLITRHLKQERNGTGEGGDTAFQFLRVIKIERKPSLVECTPP